MKILVRGTNWIGDAVMSVPALRELRRIFPEARITLHTRSWADGLFRDVDFIDELVTFDKHKWKVKDVYDNTQFLKEDGYDLAVLFPNSFESALTSFLTRIPRRIGYNKDIRGLLLTDPIAVPEWKNRRHEVYYYLNLVSAVEKKVLGRETVGSMEPRISLDISESRKESARSMLAAKGVDFLRHTVAFGVGSTNSVAKRWPTDYFAKLNDLLQLELNANVILVGSKEDSAVAQEVLAASTQKPIDITGKTDIGEAAAVLSVVNLLISNDMGLAHIAPAVGTETLAIFGPTNPETTRPFSPLSEVIRKAVECSPCMLRDCPIDHRCMTWITVEEVFEAAKLKLIPDEDDLDETTGSIS
jgi:heptosyltransferase-2